MASGMSADELFLQIILLLIGAVLGAVVQIVKPLWQKIIAAALCLLLTLTTGVWFGYDLGQDAARGSAAPPLPNRLSRRIDFEPTDDVSLVPGNIATLDICDAVPPTYYENCTAAPDALSLEAGGFTGRYSLGCRLQASPQHPQVYSINFELTPQVYVDAVSANVYISDATLFDKVWLLAHVEANDTWIYAEFPLEQNGWTRLFLDLQHNRDAAGEPIAATGIDEIDVDLFVTQTETRLVDTAVKIDDVEFYHDLPTPTVSR